MTATIFLDPVAAVAATVLRLPIPFDLTCPNDCARFGNQVPGWTVGSAWDWVPCPSCNGTGWERPCPFPVDAPDHPCVLEAT
jgi:hypothetical protein